MKRYIQITLLLAALVSMSVSCDNNNLDTSSYTFNFTSQKPVFDDEVKTVWNGNSIIWSSDDKIRVAFTVDEIWQNGSGNVETASDATLYASTQAQSEDEYVTANFSVPTDFKGTNTSGSHKFYALYPSDQVNNNDSKFTAPDVKVNVSSSQILSSDTFDSSADLMLGTSGEIDGRPTSAIPLYWNRLVAHAYITLADLKDWVEGEVVTSVTLTADAGASMTGEFDLDITTGEIVLDSGNTGSNVLTLSNGFLTVVDGDVSFWACMMPCTWSELTVEVETDKATYTRVIDLSENQKTFLKNRRNLLRIKMNDAVRVEKAVSTAYYEKVTSAPTDWSGTYLIVFNDNKARSYVSSSDLVSASDYELTISEGKISVSEITEKDNVVISTMGEGYKLKLSNDKYLTVPKSNACGNNTEANASQLTIEWTDSGVKISGVDSGGSRRYLCTNGSYYRMYTDIGTRTLPTLYRLQN